MTSTWGAASKTMAWRRRSYADADEVCDGSERRDGVETTESFEYKARHTSTSWICLQVTVNTMEIMTAEVKEHTYTKHSLNKYISTVWIYSYMSGKIEKLQRESCGKRRDESILRRNFKRSNEGYGFNKICLKMGQTLVRNWEVIGDEKASTWKECTRFE